MNDLAVEFAVDQDHPVERSAVVEALARVLISADRRRRERANQGHTVGEVADDHTVRAGGSARTCNDQPAWR